MNKYEAIIEAIKEHHRHIESIGSKSTHSMINAVSRLEKLTDYLLGMDNG